jgi:hypothetical protein
MNDIGFYSDCATEWNRPDKRPMQHSSLAEVVDV